MKYKILLLVVLATALNVSAQKKLKLSEDNHLTKFISDNGCKCVDSINISSYKSTQRIAEEIGQCIDKQMATFQILQKTLNFAEVDDDVIIDGDSVVKSTKINLDENSIEYKKSRQSLERIMFEKCPQIRKKLASNETIRENSLSQNLKAREFYSKGMKADKAGNTQSAVNLYEKAVKEDPDFAFAWDNLGLCYRKLERYDDAITAYEKSLLADPYGTMPLQNLAAVYGYKKLYKMSIATYQRLAIIDEKNPEIPFGIGRTYSLLGEYEKSLNYMCKAYNMYIEQSSPYTTDAETIISAIYVEMKKEGKSKRFDEILAENNIRQN